MKGYKWLCFFYTVKAFLPTSSWNRKRTKPHLDSTSHPNYRSRILYTATIIHTHNNNTTTTNNNNHHNKESMGIYIHIPFCRRRCRYCDFAIVPVGDEHRSGFLQLNDQYTQAILDEIHQTMSCYNSNSNDKTTTTTTKPRISSIYFGGGTPSLAPIGTIQIIMEKLYECFDVVTNSEITMEMDPATFDQEKIVALRKLGFNRISLGVQSFNNTILESIGRIHREEDIINALNILETVWYDNDKNNDPLNYSMDLISGLPGLSLAEWANTLERAMQCKPKPMHLSLYDLQVEQGTVFGRWYSESKPTTLSSSILPLPSDEEASFMYKYASGYLRWYGYEHYEVSSYALPGHRSQHNQVYWAVDGQWYAFGLGATSYINEQLVARPRTMVKYREWVQNPLTWTTTSPCKKEDRILDVVLKRLRTSEGLSLRWIRQTFGPSYEQAIRRGAALGIELNMVLSNKERIQDDEEEAEETLKLTDPEGFLYSNSILSTIFAELEHLPEWDT